MTPLLEQFLSEARDFLQDIGESLMALERDPTDSERMSALFRLVHTLKGNSGLFDFPEMTRVLHAGEDLMDAVRDQRLVYGPDIADPLLDAMDFVGILLDDIEADERIADGRMRDAARIAEELREVLARSLPAKDDDAAAAAEDDSAQPGASVVGGSDNAVALPGLASPLASLSPRERQFWPLMRQSLAQAPESLRESLLRAAFDPQTPGPVLHWVAYTPEEDAFYKGEDPLYQVIQLADVEWRRVVPREPWPALVDLDAYQCVLRFEWLTRMDAAALDQHFRYVPEQVVYLPVTPAALLPLDAARDPEQEAAVFAALRNTLAELPQDSGLVALWRWLLLVLELNPAARAQWGPWLEGLANVPAQAVPAEVDVRPAEAASQPVLPTEKTADEPAPEPLDETVATLYTDIWETQREVLELSDKPGWFEGRLRGVVASLAALLASAGRQDDQITLTQAFMEALAQQDPAPLRDWLQAQPEWIQGRAQAAVQPAADVPEAASAVTPDVSPDAVANPEVSPVADVATVPAGSGEAPAFGRRAEDHPTNKILKVDQGKIDRLMGLIGEMVVAKNALPYLAGRAEKKYGVRELSREIRAQYGVINRIAEEMQDAIMQVRMLPVSFVLQRFPRLVRDLSRKLGKQVRLEIEGESTEADKNIIEAMADPLVHIVRNSLDHGLEMPEQRQAQGKPVEGRLTIRASQVSDRVVIEIIDDGRGIDPEAIRHKAYERGLLDEAELERLTDREAVNLVFAAGFSTAEQISDVSGRGVGMDVVRTAITRLNGSIELESEVNRGTRLRLSLPLSMAVSHVMIIESAGQRFGVPMDAVAETVRIPTRDIRGLKHHQTAVLRGQIVPVLSLNELLGFAEPQHPNEDDEYAALVVRIEQEQVGVLVDECREAVDIILKPFSGILQGLSGYAGSALLGDGTVLLVINPRELLG